MTDDQTPAENGDGVTTPSAAPTDEVTTPKGDEQAPPSGGDEGQPASTEVVTDPKPPAGDKPPTRGEKRIRDLARKVKEASSGSKPADGANIDTPPRTTPSPEQHPSPLPWLTEAPNILNDKGEVDPDKFSQEVTQQAKKIAEDTVRETLSKKERGETYRRSVSAWADDMEKTARETPELNPESPEYNPDLDSALQDLIVQTNFTADGVLVPTVAASELFGKLKKALDRAKESGTKAASASLAQQISEEAVSPGNGSPAKAKPSLVELRKGMNKNPQAVADALERSLPHTED